MSKKRKIHKNKQTKRNEIPTKMKMENVKKRGKFRKMNKLKEMKNQQK